MLLIVFIFEEVSLIEMVSTLQELCKVDLQLIVLTTKHPWLAEVLQLGFIGTSSQATFSYDPQHGLEVCRFLLKFLHLCTNFLDCSRSRVDEIKEDELDARIRTIQDVQFEQPFALVA